MKGNKVRTAFAGFFAVVLLVGMAGHAQAEEGCSLARSKGKWSFTDNGTVIGVGPRTAVGIFTMDGAGNIIDAAATSSLNGAIAAETFSGTYTVNSDCTGKVNVTIYSSGIEVLALTMYVSFDSDMRELRGVFTSATLPDGTPLATVINLQARKQ